MKMIKIKMNIMMEHIANHRENSEKEYLLLQPLQQGHRIQQQIKKVILLIHQVVRLLTSTHSTAKLNLIILITLGYRMIVRLIKLLN